MQCLAYQDLTAVLSHVHLISSSRWLQHSEPYSFQIPKLPVFFPFPLSLFLSISLSQQWASRWAFRQVLFPTLVFTHSALTVHLTLCGSFHKQLARNYGSVSPNCVCAHITQSCHCVWQVLWWWMLKSIVRLHDSLKVTVCCYHSESIASCGRNDSVIVQRLANREIQSKVWFWLRSYTFTSVRFYTHPTRLNIWIYVGLWCCKYIVHGPNLSSSDNECSSAVIWML